MDPSYSSFKASTLYFCHHHQGRRRGCEQVEQEGMPPTHRAKGWPLSMALPSASPQQSISEHKPNTQQLQDQRRLQPARHVHGANGHCLGKRSPSRGGSGPWLVGVVQGSAQQRFEGDR